MWIGEKFVNIIHIINEMFYNLNQIFQIKRQNHWNKYWYYCLLLFERNLDLDLCP